MGSGETPAWRGRLREWLRRYLPAELLGTATALIGGLIAYEATGSLATAAIVASLSECVGYYGYFSLLEIRRHRDSVVKATAAERPHKPPLLATIHAIRDLIIEFGPAELLDGVLLRPFLMFVGPQLLGGVAVGLLAGKIAADVVFYALAAVGYELVKRRRAAQEAGSH